VDHARSTLDSEEESGCRIASISSRLARASAIGNCHFYVSLFVVAAPREQQQQVSAGTFAETARDARERVETARATGRFERESEGEFLLFIYELFIRLVELSLSLPFSSSRRTRVRIQREKETEGMGKRAESSAREGAGNLSFARGGKNATFFRVAGRVAPADFSHKETE